MKKLKTWKSCPSTKARVLNILISAKTKNHPLTANQISYQSGIKRNTVNKYLLRLFREGLVQRLKTAHGYFKYLATENAETWTDLGGVPRYSLKDVLDIEHIATEDRKAKIHLRDRLSKTVRNACCEAKKGDRAKWRSYDGEGFRLAITKNGVLVLTVHNIGGWQGNLRQWLESIGIRVLDVEGIMSDLGVAFASGYGRIEVPIKTPLLRESNMNLEVVTTFGKDTVKTNINRSGAMLGWEMSGPNYFLDIVTAELSSFQHKLAMQVQATKIGNNRTPDYYG